MVKPNPGHRLDEEELQWDAHNPVNLWIYTPPMHVLSASLMVALGEVCIKQPHGVVPSPLAAVEETQSVLGAEVLKEAGWSCPAPLSGEPGVPSYSESRSPCVG